MNTINDQLCDELDMANQAIKSFVSNYTLKMQTPLDLIASVIIKMEESDDPITLNAHLETLQRTVAHMDMTLNGLMGKLEASQNPQLLINKDSFSAFGRFGKL